MSEFSEQWHFHYNMRLAQVAFKEGDRVTYTGDFTDEYKGLTGTVQRVSSPTNIQVKWDVKPKGWGDVGGVFPDNLTLIPLKLEETLNEIQQYKKTVLNVALRVKEEQDWCDEEFWPVMKELGIDKPPEMYYPEQPQFWGEIYQIQGYVVYLVWSQKAGTNTTTVIYGGTGDVKTFQGPDAWKEAIDSVRKPYLNGAKGVIKKLAP